MTRRTRHPSRRGAPQTGRRTGRTAVEDYDAETIAAQFRAMGEDLEAAFVPYDGSDYPVPPPGGYRPLAAGDAPAEDEAAGMPRRGRGQSWTGPQPVRHTPPEFGTLARVHAALKGETAAAAAAREPVYARLEPRMRRGHVQVPGKALLAVRTRRVITAQARIEALAYPRCDGFSEPEGYEALMREADRLTGTAVPLPAPLRKQTRAVTDGWNRARQPAQRVPIFIPREAEPRSSRGGSRLDPRMMARIRARLKGVS